MESRGAMSRRRFLVGAAGVTVAGLSAALGSGSPVAARSTDSLIVNTAGARLRSGPGTGYAVVASLAKGTEVRYLADGGTANGYRWYKVMVLSSGKQGYVAASLLSAPGSTGNPGFPYNVTVLSGPLNVRRYPTTSAAVVGVVAAGTRGWLTQRTFVEADGHRWAEVRFDVPGFVTGHVSMAYVKIT